MSSLKSALRSMKWADKAKKIFKNDHDVFSSCCAGSKQSKNNGSEAARDILVFCHMVEKGLSHKELKPLFGHDRVLRISESLEKYIKEGGKDPFITGLAVSTLNRYNEVNKSLGVPEESLIKIPDTNMENNPVEVGIADISEKDYFSARNASFSEFSKARHSVRLYDCKSLPVNKEELLECIKTAQISPSACNRQAVRAKVILNPDLIKKICDIQGGARGFGENSGAVIVITSDYRLYQIDERRMPMLDCGLFIMNLVYALYEKGLASCILNGSFGFEREAQMKEVLPIPEYEEYAAVISVSKIPENETIKVARSSKRDTDDIVTVIS